MVNFLILLGLLLLCIPSPPVYASQPLETETARLLKAGSFKVDATYEYQTSSEGTEHAVPLAFEYGVTDYLGLLVEPVVYTAILPKAGRKATGLGDLEITLFYLFLDESPTFPALAIAGEVKVPTADNALIGTGETDYTPFLIASKQFGQWNTHVNFGYSILGEPPGVTLKNIFTYAAAVEYRLNEQWDLVAEVIGSTSSSPRGGRGESPGEGTRARATEQNPGAENFVVPEASGAEVAGLLGARYYIRRPNLFLSIGVTYDNSNAVLLRPGVTWRF